MPRFFTFDCFAVLVFLFVVGGLLVLYRIFSLPTGYRRPIPKPYPKDPVSPGLDEASNTPGHDNYYNGTASRNDTVSDTDDTDSSVDNVPARPAKPPPSWYQVSSVPAVPFGVPLTCQNTAQSPYMVTDSEGYTCSLLNLDPSRPGCCLVTADTQKYTGCSSCDADAQCCPSFESCVSCCLNPEASEDPFEVLLGRTRNPNVYNGIRDRFVACTNICRTHSRSTEHENSYRNAGLKHCYGPGQSPMKQP